MILNAKKIFLLLIAASTADAANVTGWLYDNLCINNCEGTSGPTSCTPDGSNAFYTPSVHTGECLLFDFCIQSGHSIMSEFPGEDGRHSIVLKLVDEANTTAYELVKDSGITTEFPKVVAVFDDSQVVSTDADGVPSVSTVTSLTYEAPPKDPWAENPDKYYSGAPTTQAVCNKPSDGRWFNNLCFRSDVEVSVEDGMLVIESNGCPDHMSMTGGSDGTIENENEFPCDVFEFAPGCNREKPGGCCGKCGGCNACSDKCNACATYCAGVCSSKTCSACGDSCSASTTVENNPETTLTDGYTLKYTINEADATVTMEVTYDGEAWVGIAFSEDERMGGSDGILGTPDDGIPQKYRLNQGFIEIMSPEEQTLTDASVVVNENGQTVMKFTKALVEPNQIPIISGENKMLWANGGESTTIGYHGSNRSPFSLDINFAGGASGCSSKACGACSDSCSAKTCSTCSTRALEGCNACGNGCSNGCSPKACNACGNGCSPKACNACGTSTYCSNGCWSNTCNACGASGCSKCENCSTGGCGGKCCGACGGGGGGGGKCCGGKCCGNDPIGKYTPTFQHYTLKIPKVPGAPGEKKLLEGDVVGMMFNGVILDSHKQTWAYDMCNGHSDENHQYHYHIPQSCYLESLGVAFADSPNWWINDAGDQVRKFDEMAAQFPATAPASPVIGMALDGHPIYGLYDDKGDLQRSKAFGGSLDECNGKMDSQNNYGYYLSVDPPFSPACLKGSTIGTFEYSTYNKACPKEGIKNTIQFPSDGEVEVEAEADDPSSAPINIYLSAVASLVAYASAFFF